MNTVTIAIGVFSWSPYCFHFHLSSHVGYFKTAYIIVLIACKAQTFFFDLYVFWGAERGWGMEVLIDKLEISFLKEQTHVCN